MALTDALKVFSRFVGDSEVNAERHPNNCRPQPDSRDAGRDVVGPQTAGSTLAGSASRTLGGRAVQTSFGCDTQMTPRRWRRTAASALPDPEAHRTRRPEP